MHIRRPSCRLATTLLCLAGPVGAAQQSLGDWAIHDRNRPEPRVVDPGTASTGRAAGPAALGRGRAVRRQGPVAVARQKDRGGRRRGRSRTATSRSCKERAASRPPQAFGDCQLHVEWAAPSPPVGTDQDRGNSGVFLMGQYEVQVLDSYQSQTYPDGQAAALYGQYPPLVNAARPPGQWQTYDIVFHAPRFDADGDAHAAGAHDRPPQRRPRAGRRSELTGPTAHKARPALQGARRQAAARPAGPRPSRCASATSGSAS